MLPSSSIPFYFFIFFSISFYCILFYFFLFFSISFYSFPFPTFILRDSLPLLLLSFYGRTWHAWDTSNRHITMLYGSCHFSPWDSYIIFHWSNLILLRDFIHSCGGIWVYCFLSHHFMTMHNFHPKYWLNWKINQLAAGLTVNYTYKALSVHRREYK